MGKAKQTRKFAVAKKMISPKDTRVKENLEKAKKKEAEKKKKEEPRQVEQAVSALFFQYNEQLGPPYHVLVDTNFINFSIRCVACWFMSYVMFVSDENIQHHKKLIWQLILPHYLFFESIQIILSTQEKAGYGAGHDGLSFGQVHPVHHRLCHGRIGKAWGQV